MDSIAIDHLHDRLCAQLPPHVRESIDMKVVGPSGLSVKIDGERCLTSIGVWPNGCCDVEYLFVSTEKGESRHFEFDNVDSALTIVLREINMAVERA